LQFIRGGVTIQHKILMWSAWLYFDLNQAGKELILPLACLVSFAQQVTRSVYKDLTKHPVLEIEKHLVGR
jgi:hypothetical protein